MDEPDFRENTIQGTSFDEEEAMHTNLQECQKYFFPLPKSPFASKGEILSSDSVEIAAYDKSQICRVELVCNRPAIEQSFSSSDLFGIGSKTDQVVPSSNAQLPSKFDDEVFSLYDTNCDSYTNGLQETWSQSLPDLVPKSPDQNNDTEKKNSPDVIHEHMNDYTNYDFVDSSYPQGDVEIDKKNYKGQKYNLEGPVHHAGETIHKKHPVSFEPNLKWKEKRDSFRKSCSSGYGTGDNDASVSVIQSQDSTCTDLGENSVDDGNTNLQESFTRDSTLSVYSASPAQTFIREHQGQNCNSTTSAAMSSSGNLPNSHLFEFILTVSPKASSADSRTHTSVSHRTVPRFEDLLDESMCLTSADFFDDIQTGLEEMLKTVQKKYCHSSSGSSTDGMSKTSPGFSTRLAMTVLEQENRCDRKQTADAKAIKKDMYINYSDIESDLKDDMSKYYLDNFMKCVTDGCPITKEMYKELIDNMALWTTPSTTLSQISVKSPCIQGVLLHKEEAATCTSTKIADGMREIHASDLESAYRCRDQACMDDMCRKVKDSILCILENKENMGNQMCIESVYHSLWEHCKECCELKCSIPWCYQLQVDLDHIDEFELKNVAPIVKNCLQTPLMQFASFDLHKGKFIKLGDDYPNNCFEEWQLLFGFGQYKNTVLIRQFHNVPVDYILKKMPKFECNQQLNVYMSLLNMNHPNLIPHLWAMDYEDQYVMHVCTPFLKSASLEEYLNQRRFLEWDEAIWYIGQVIQAVIHLHSLGIIYLNWKSSNVMFADPSKFKVQLSNMSSSVCMDSAFDVGSTRLYLPPSIVTPELLLHDAKLLKKSDVWGACCLLKEILSTKPVWNEHRHETAEVIWEIIRKSDHPPLPDRLTEWQKAIFMDCWKKCPEERIGLEELKQRLRHGGTG